MQTISKEEFKEKLESGEYELLDVRTLSENQQRNIAGAKLIDIQQPDFEQKINALDKDKKYLLYCASGMRSKSAGMFMDSLGFKEVYDLEGGIFNWE